MKLGIALGGGAAKGLAHIGVLKRLAEANIVPELISGTSIGAIIGAAAACGKLDAAAEVFRTLNWPALAKTMSPTVSFSGAFSGSKFEKTLQNVLGCKEFSDLPIPLAVVSCDVTSGELITHTSGDLIRAVRASISLPGLFTPVAQEAQQLVDGGILEPVPTKAVRDLGADYVIAVDLFRDYAPPTKKAGNFVDILERSLCICFKELSLGRAKLYPADYTIAPNVAEVGCFSFGQHEAAIALGREAAEAALPALSKALFSFSK